MQILLDKPLHWPDIASISSGAALSLSADARQRIDAANGIVRSIVEKSIRAYGVNTGVGALSDLIISKERQAALSHNILLSHAVGVGPPLSVAGTRAIMAAMVNNFAHGYSGLRLLVVQHIVDLLNAGCTPCVPAQGSVGYLSHAAQIGLALIGYGPVDLKGERMPARAALQRLNLTPLVLQAKEGLCLANGTPCVTGLACVVAHEARRIMDWADVIAAMTFETQRGQIDAFDPAAMTLRSSPGLQEVANTLNRLLAGSAILAAARGRRTQDALSLRGIPQIHGAVRDAWHAVVNVVDDELASVTDNPLVTGTVDAPKVYSQAHPVGAAIGLAMDQIATAIAELGGISSSRMDRMVHPALSGLPAFLAHPGGTASGFMIAQYTAVSLVGENRRLAAPASLDGGSTSGSQEDILCHATPAALKALQIVANTRNLLAIELLAAAQSYDLLGAGNAPAQPTSRVYRALRERIPTYADNRPLGEDIASAAEFIEQQKVEDLVH
jgi:histidine ammonia-lyase